jgi:hypothetical protein
VIAGEASEREVADRVGWLLGRAVTATAPLAGGANNRLLRVDASGECYVAKCYHRSADDPRDRLGAEFGMLAHLWRGGLRCIPEPVVADPEAGIGVVRFVEGAPIAPGEVGRPETEALAALLAAMRSLRETPGADRLPDASEATFSDRALIDLLERRLGRLRAGLETESASADAARHFVEECLAPALAAQRAALAERPGFEDPLPAGERTLSPSDHGFHNALRRPDGTLVFLDFEYAGWDDPATMLADACLQPRVPMPGVEKTRFLADLLPKLANGPSLALRLRRLYPVWALKWCLILLNEFVPGDRARRRFAGVDSEARRGLQLEKARNMLQASEDSGFIPEPGDRRETDTREGVRAC